MSYNRKPVLLIVDDNPQNLQFIGHLVEEKGYEPVLALSGNQALGFIDKELPDLILLDIMMPDMDGFEVCKRLKKRSDTKNIPIIFLTAKTETEDIIKGFRAGAVDYVKKPFNSLELLARVKTHIDLKLAREEIKTLRGTIPVCANCKSIKDEKGKWLNMEKYLNAHSEAQLSHGLCPSCLKKLYPDLANEIMNKL